MNSMFERKFCQKKKNIGKLNVKYSINHWTRKKIFNNKYSGILSKNISLKHHKEKEVPFLDDDHKINEWISCIYFVEQHGNERKKMKSELDFCIENSFFIRNSMNEWEW